MKLNRRDMIKLGILSPLIIRQQANAQLALALLVLAVGTMAGCTIIYVSTRPPRREVLVIRLDRHYIGDKNPDGTQRWAEVYTNTIPFSESGNYYPAFSDWIDKHQTRACIYRCVNLGPAEPMLLEDPHTVGPVQPEQRWYTPEELGVS